MRQLTLFPNTTQVQVRPVRHTFSHDGVCCETARLALESRYGTLLEETNEFSRKIVSFQANRTKILHSWFKYREGFSSTLVEILIDKFGIGPGDMLFDPFAGSGTTLLVAQMLGVDAMGIELLPHSQLAWQVKSQVFNYDVDELRHIRKLVSETTPPPTLTKFPHLTITRTAFPEQTERDLMAYTGWVETLKASENAKNLCRFILVSILEKISYTRKDGQYLRWDRRAEKVRERNKERVARGKKPTKGIYKGNLPDVRSSFIAALDKIIFDVVALQKDPPPPSQQTLIKGNTLYTLPKIEANRFAGVITSPPYANRYDYTRTYALELAYLGVGKEIFNLRQDQLSCTVESKSKVDQLGTFYQSIGQANRYAHILAVAQNNAALAEINTALQIRNQRGDVNNRGVLTMINQYFTEMTLVFAELYRACRSGAYVVFVNDNVRYAGEIIPVDMLSTNLAAQIGFEPVKVYVLPQRKGNSSQQMGKFGREALRKSITLWQKP